MDCNETRRLLDADIDGELDLVRHLELETHLRACPDCARLAESARARRTVLHESLPRYAATPHLAQKIRAALPRPAVPVAVAQAVPKRAKIPFPFWQLTGLAASLTLAGLIGFAWGNARTQASLLIDEAVSDHVRSLQASHLADIVSTDQHTVKPWFAGKLDFAPPVVDLATAGFPLAGGRLEHFGGRPAAALVFHRRQHVINVFIWPVSTTALPPRRAARNGYNAETWTHAGLNFLAISEIPATELKQFSETFRASAP